MSTSLPIHGRGASSNPPNRFIPLYRESIPGWTEEEDPAPRTRFFKDTSRTVIATNDSPDVGFTHSLNPYRGCEHGCCYCFARPFHEHLELSEVAVPVCGRWITAGTEQVRRLVVKAKRLHWGNHRSAATTRDEQRFLTHLARQRAREWMLEQLINPLRVACEQGGTK